MRRIGMLLCVVALMVVVVAVSAALGVAQPSACGGDPNAEPTLAQYAPAGTDRNGNGEVCVSTLPNGKVIFRDDTGHGL